MLWTLPALCCFQGQPGSTREDFPGVLWARSGAGGQAGSPGPGAWALIQSGIISEYLCECVCGFTQSQGPLEGIVFPDLPQEGLNNPSNQPSLILTLISPSQHLQKQAWIPLEEVRTQCLDQLDSHLSQCGNWILEDEFLRERERETISFYLGPA